MEEDGILYRKVYPVVPPKVEYTLTEMGYSLKMILDVLHQYGETYREKFNKDNKKP